jgi:hypothetical protein
MDELDREIQDRISRRRMIKRIGAATAVAWTAPVLSTLSSSPAFAQYDGVGPCGNTDCPPRNAPIDQHCASQVDCGAEPSGNPCSCVRTIEDTCGCHSCVFCDNPAITPCGSSGACPSGWLCALSCCSDAAGDFRCLPQCGRGDNPDPCVGARAGTIRRRTSMGVI